MLLLLCAISMLAVEEPAAEPVRLRLPGESWSLVLELPGFELGRPRIRGEGARLELAGHALESGLVVSVTLERARHEGDARAYRESLWKEIRRDSTFDLRGTRRSEHGDMALLEYTLPAFQGVDVNQRNLHALIVRDGVWVDVHLSMSDYDEERDGRLFEAVIDSIRFED